MASNYNSPIASSIEHVNSPPLIPQKRQKNFHVPLKYTLSDTSNDTDNEESTGSMDSIFTVSTFGDTNYNLSAAPKLYLSDTRIAALSPRQKRKSKQKRKNQCKWKPNRAKSANDHYQQTKSLNNRRNGILMIDYPNPKKKQKLKLLKEKPNKNNADIKSVSNASPINKEITPIVKTLHDVNTIKKTVITEYNKSMNALQTISVSSWDSLIKVEKNLESVEVRVNHMSELENKLNDIQTELKNKKVEKTLQFKLLNSELESIDQSLNCINDLNDKIYSIREQSNQVNMTLKIEKKKYCKNMLLQINKDLGKQKHRKTEMKDEEDDNEYQSLCIICEDNINNMVCVPCGHNYLCFECVEEREDENGKITKCDICQQEVQMIIKTYNSGFAS